MVVAKAKESELQVRLLILFGLSKNS